MNTKNRKLTDTVQEATSTMTDQARDTLANVNNSLMKAIDQNRIIAQNLVRAMQEESLRFVNQRLEHTSRAIEKSRECQGFSQLITLQQDWLMDVARDYAELNKRFGEVLHEMAEHGADNANEFVADTSRSVQKPETGGERVAAE